MTDYRVKEIENKVDLDLLRKGRCPWCTKKLVPFFEDLEEMNGIRMMGKHVGEECLNCKDRFF